MIRAECAIFFAMLAAGLLAQLSAAVLLTLGRGSRVARAICDALCPIAVGVIFLYALHEAASGIFRLYALVAFLLGMVVGSRLLRRLSPHLRKLGKKLILPIKSLSDALENRVSAAFAPLAEKRRARREMRLEKKRVKQVRRKEERERRFAAKRERMERVRRQKRRARSAGSAALPVRREKVPFEQSD